MSVWKLPHASYDIISATICKERTASVFVECPKTIRLRSTTTHFKAAAAFVYGFFPENRLFIFGKLWYNMPVHQAGGLMQQNQFI